MFEIKFGTDNAAFGNAEFVQEIEWIFAETVRKLWMGYKKGIVRDSNGNTIGTFTTEA